MDGKQEEGRSSVDATADPPMAGRGSEVVVSEFNTSVDKFFEVSDAISSLCGSTMVDEQTADQGELQRLSSMITFLTEWKYFNYEPKTVNFAYETETGEAKNANVISGIRLPQFSSASIPKTGPMQMEDPLGGESGAINCKDFVLHAGGSVWALDWCPRVHEKPDSQIRCEYLAVAAHPPGYSYHQIGLPLTGRGIVQIWCIPNVKEEGESLYNNYSNEIKSSATRSKGRPRKSHLGIESLDNCKEKSPATRPRGRPRKNPPVIESLDNCIEKSSGTRPEGIPRKNNDPMGSIGNCKEKSSSPKGRGRPRKESIAVEYPLDSSGERLPRPPKRPRGRPRKQLKSTESSNVSNGTEIVCLTDALPASGVDLAGDPFTVPCLNVLDSANNGDSMLRNVTDEKFKIEKSADLSVEKKAYPPKRGRGRPKKNSVVTKVLDACNGNKLVNPTSSDTGCSIELGEDASFVPATTGFHRNAHVESVLSHETDEKIMKEALGGLNIEENLSSIKWCKGRPRKDQPVSEPYCAPCHDRVLNPSNHCTAPNSELGVDSSKLTNGRYEAGEELTRETLVNINNEGKQLQSMQHKGVPRKRPGGTVSFDALTGKEASNHTSICHASNFELGDDGSLLPGRSELVASDGNSGAIREADGHVTTKTSYLDNKGNLSPLSLCKGNPRKIPAGINSCDALNDVEVLSISNFCAPSNVELGNKNTSVSPSTAELITEQNENAIVQRCNEGLLLQEYKGSVMENFVAESGLDRCMTERGMEDKVTAVTDIAAVAPILSNTSEGAELLTHDNLAAENHGLDSIHEVGHEVPLKINWASSHLHKDIALPRVVLCLAHMGRVAWDVKWRPCSANDLASRQCMGYLAVVLGNGSLEVWEVPLPSMVKILYTSYDKEGTDPRFLRLKPVFRCSKLKSGERQSIPLTVEWSPSTPYDLLLAGCHDGTIALWKFSPNDSSLDSKPLLFFTADTVPIRAIAWAPDESDAESANIFVTAGHEGLKFWDIRDPYRPLWEVNPVQKHILSVDWLINPRCIMLSFDDGTLRVLSLLKAASDIPLTGKPSSNGAKSGFHCYVRSSFAIWSIQVSRVSGLVAYCGADGSTSRFQLTLNSVEKDSSRYRTPHFLCGSLFEEDQNLTINIPLPNISLEDAPRNVHGFQPDTTQGRITSPQVAGNDLAFVSVSAQSQVNSSSKTAPKTRVSQMEIHNPSETMDIICGVEEKQQDNVQPAVNMEPVKPREIFPSKSIALHKVRWNMNLGSERWLCYGGAAGDGVRSILVNLDAYRLPKLSLHISEKPPGCYNNHRWAIAFLVALLKPSGQHSLSPICAFNKFISH